jgi:hypothetical protein
MEANVKKVRIFTLLSAVVVTFLLVSGTAWAKKPKCPAGLAGTWAGGAGNDIRWLATHTSDSRDPTKGEMIMNWTYIKYNFIGAYGSGVTLTPGHGVWQENDDGNYDYTWYAYAIEDDGTIDYTIRVSGVALLKDPFDLTVTDCDTAVIYYEFDMAAGEVLPTDLATAEFSTMTSGGAGEVRVPLTVTPLPTE